MFQSTHLQEVRQYPKSYRYFSNLVSIHAPTRGATCVLKIPLPDVDVSIHAPTRGATIFLLRFISRERVSIHAPTRGATLILSTILSWEQEFQSTHLQEVRLQIRCKVSSDCKVSIHAPTRGATQGYSVYE